MERQHLWQSVAIGFDNFQSYLPLSLKHPDLTTALLINKAKDCVAILFTSETLFKDPVALKQLNNYLHMVTACNLDPRVQNWTLEQLRTSMKNNDC